VCFSKETDMVVIGKGVFVERRFGLSLNSLGSNKNLSIYEVPNFRQ